MPVGRSSSPTHQQGAQAEDAAASFLQQQGYQLVAQNFNTRFGEIDLIVQHAQQLVFVEVRQRKVNSLVSALESITLAKQRKIIKAAQGFLQQHQQYHNHDCRFDVIALTSKSVHCCKKQPDLAQFTEQDISVPFELEWIQAAFDAT